MVKPFRRLWIAIFVLALAGCAFTYNPIAYSEPVQKSAPFVGAFDVRKYGAKGDGKALDSPAINKAIDAAAAAGGGTVLFTAGTYRSFSIRLKSNVALYLDQGATILAAHPNDGDGKYDLPEPNSWDQYQRRGGELSQSGSTPGFLVERCRGRGVHSRQSAKRSGRAVVCAEERFRFQSPTELATRRSAPRSSRHTQALKST